MRLALLALLTLTFFGSTSYAADSTRSLESGLILSFIPKGATEPLGTIVDTNSNFKADSFRKEPALERFANNPHWLRWEGFYNVKKTGKYMFAFSGASRYSDCRFEAIIASQKLFTVEGIKFQSGFGHKVLNLEQGAHKFEATLKCNDYRGAYAQIDVKRPGSRVIGKINQGEFLYRK